MTEGEETKEPTSGLPGDSFTLPATEAEFAAVPIQAAATVLIIRDRPSGSVSGSASASLSGDGIETLLLQRRPGSVFVPGVHVFPGGRVDDQDYDLVDAGFTTGWPGDAESRSQRRRPVAARAGTDEDDIDGGLPLDLGFWAAALRETFEETGLLLAQPTLSPSGSDPGRDMLSAARSDRAAVDAGKRTMVEVCAEHEIALDTASMVYFGHWTTPMGSPRRYDTQFFVARCPPGQEVEPDGVEAVDAIWRAPVDAVQATLAGEMDLILPTYRSLVALTRFSNTEEVLAALWPHGPKSGRMVSDEGGGFRVSLPPWDPTNPPATKGREPFPRIPPEIRARRGTND